MGFLRSMALGAVIDIQTGNSLAAVGRLSGAFSQASQSAGRFAIGGLRSFGQGAGAMSVAAGGLAVTLLGIGAAGLKVAGDFQATSIAFETMLGSAEAAAQFIGELREFAATTPFEFTDLTLASQKMKALGFETEDVIPLLTDVGNAVAGMSGDSGMMDRIILALGQMRAKGKATTEEMNQLLETGVFGWQNLADHIGKTVPEAMEMVTAGEIKAETMIEAFAAHSQATFGGLMEKQSKTFFGQLSNMKDSAVSTMTTAFTPMLEPLSEILGMINGMAVGMETAHMFGQGMADALFYILDAGKQIQAQWGGIVTDFVGGLESSGELAYELGFVALAVTAIVVAAVPVLAILAALALGVAALGELFLPLVGVITLGVVAAMGLLAGAFTIAEARGVSMFTLLSGWWAAASEGAAMFVGHVRQTVDHFGGFHTAIDILGAAWNDLVLAFGLGSYQTQEDVNGIAATFGGLVGMLVSVAGTAATIMASIVRIGTFLFLHIGRPLSSLAFTIMSGFVKAIEVIAMMIMEVGQLAKDNPITRWALSKLGIDLGTYVAPNFGETPTITEPDLGESPMIDILDSVSEQQSAVTAPDVPPPPKQKTTLNNNVSVNVDGKEVARATKKAEVELTERAGFSLTPWQRRQIVEQGATVLPTQ